MRTCKLPVFVRMAYADQGGRRTTTVTLQVLNEYKDMVRSTSQDLEDHLRDIDAKLQGLAAPTETPSPATRLDVAQIENERSSVEVCLHFCNDVLCHIDEMRFQPIMPGRNPKEMTTSDFRQRDLTRAEVVTLSGLKACSDILSETVEQLHAQRASTLSEVRVVEEETDVSIQKLEGELNSTQQCLEICNGAAGRASDSRVHVVENMEMGHDGQQLFVSSLGHLFDVRGVSAGDRAIQFVGSVSDLTLQHFFTTTNPR
jgi:hypothetical protein